MLLQNISTQAVSPPSLNYKVNRATYSDLQKSDYTCKACGFKSRPSKQVLSGYMDVIQGHCYCTLCSLALKLGQSVNGKREHGLIVWAPHITQPQISHLVRVSVFTQLNSESALVASRADELLDSLRARPLDRDVFDVWDAEPGSVAYMANVISGLCPSNKSIYAKLFSGARYVPHTEKAIADIVSYWGGANPSYFKSN